MWSKMLPDLCNVPPFNFCFENVWSRCEARCYCNFCFENVWSKMWSMVLQDPCNFQPLLWECLIQMWSKMLPDLCNPDADPDADKMWSMQFALQILLLWECLISSRCYQVSAMITFLASLWCEARCYQISAMLCPSASLDPDVMQDVTRSLQWSGCSSLESVWSNILYFICTFHSYKMMAVQESKKRDSQLQKHFRSLSWKVFLLML